jgi:biotin transport system permease protein
MLTLTYSNKTWAHGVPAGAKLAALALATAGLFALQSSAHLALAALAGAGLIASGGARFSRESLRALTMLWPFVVVVGAWHLWLGDPNGASIILRMITAVALANFVTMTTRLSDMITVLEWGLRPFSRIIPAPRLALAIALTIRFVPVFLLRMADLQTAWRARAARPPRWRILPAMTLAALDDAARVAESLRARGGAP